MTNTGNQAAAAEQQDTCAGGVVIGVDGSDASAAAFRWGLREASVRGTFAVAAMAYSYLEQHHAGKEAFDPAYTERDAVAALDAYVTRAGAGGDHTGLRQLVGCDLPGRYLVESSKSAAMLVVGRRGLGYLREALIGSTSHYCLRHAECPLAIVTTSPASPSKPASPLQHIVVGVDDWHSFAAMRWAVDAAARHRATVEVLHVRWPHTPAVGDFMFHDDEALRNRESLGDIDLMLTALDTSELSEPVRRTVLAGAPLSVLLERSATADLVVVGARPAPRRHVSPRWLPERLVHHASCPVVVVPGSSTRPESVTPEA